MFISRMIQKNFLPQYNFYGIKTGILAIIFAALLNSKKTKYE